MAINFSTEPGSTLPDILDNFWSVIDDCELNDHNNCIHWRNRPHMLAYFSSTLKEGKNQTLDEEFSMPKGPPSLSNQIDDSQILKDLDLILKAITKLHDLKTTTKAINRVDAWRVQQPKFLNAQKSVEDNKHFRHTYSQTVQELVKLHNEEKTKWKSDRYKWKLETESLKLTCRKLKDEACAKEQLHKKLTLESQRRRAGDNQKVSSTVHVPPGKLGTSSSDRMRGKLSQSQIVKEMERNPEYKGKSKAEDWAAQQQVPHVIPERQTRYPQPEQEKLEELCRDLLVQLELRNKQIRCTEMELERASKRNALAHRQIMEQREQIQRLNLESRVGECIICTNEFANDQGRQRAYWKDCHHANICYKCTKTLWNSRKRQCPTCKTVASSMPVPLPPRIYL